MVLTFFESLYKGLVAAGIVGVIASLIAATVVYMWLTA